MNSDFVRLVEHYRANRRDLPWRRNTDLYPVLVSELMLQQTRVETVIPYFERFLARFPTAAALARAPEEEVLAAWSGLGYYRRARLLHRAAPLLDQVEPDLDSLRALPGVGEYTAAALLSIACGKPAVALDGNAIRVLSRYHGVAEPDSVATRRRLTEMTLPGIPLRAAGDFTQAVMELGATFCQPRNPRCLLCPVAGGCRAHLEARTAEIPPPKPSRPLQEVRRLVVRAEREGQTLLVRESDSPILAGMWQFPYFENRSPESLTELFGPLRELGEVRHGITFRKIFMRVLGASELRGGLPFAEWRWFSSPEGLAVPSFVKKIYSLSAS